MSKKINQKKSANVSVYHTGTAQEARAAFTKKATTRNDARNSYAERFLTLAQSVVGAYPQFSIQEFHTFNRMEIPRQDLERFFNIWTSECERLGLLTRLEGLVYDYDQFVATSPLFKTTTI